MQMTPPEPAVAFASVVDIVVPVIVKAVPLIQKTPPWVAAVKVVKVQEVKERVLAAVPKT